MVMISDHLGLCMFTLSMFAKTSYSMMNKWEREREREKEIEEKTIWKIYIIKCMRMNKSDPKNLNWSKTVQHNSNQQVLIVNTIQ